MFIVPVPDTLERSMESISPVFIVPLLSVMCALSPVIIRYALSVALFVMLIVAWPSECPMYISPVVVRVEFWPCILIVPLLVVTLDTSDPIFVKPEVTVAPFCIFSVPWPMTSAFWILNNEFCPCMLMVLLPLSMGWLLTPPRLAPT